MDQVFQLSFHNPGPFRIDPATLPPAAQRIAAANRAALITYAGRPPMTATPPSPGASRRSASPTLVLWGDGDQIVDPDYGRAWAAAIRWPGSSCWPTPATCRSWRPPTRSCRRSGTSPGPARPAGYHRV